MKKIVFLTTTLITLLSLVAMIQPARAQESASSGIATYIVVKGTTHPGDIVTLTKNGYELSATPYDPSVFGIIVENPSVSFENTTLKDGQPVISSGKAYVRITTANGAIKKGDPITTSNIPGVGQKATQDGFVIGTALQDYSSKDQKKIGKILIILNISYNGSQNGTLSGGSRGNLLQSISQAASAPYLTPLSALRYVLAGILVITSFIIALIFFGKISSTGVEAIGRNPMAGRLILISVIFHIFLATLIILAGVGIAYLLLVI